MSGSPGPQSGLSGLGDSQGSPLYLTDACIGEEASMNFNQISRLVRLHEKAEQHSNEYKKLLGNCSAQSKALRHLREAERLRSRISRLIRDLTAAAI